jgi:hypothetical protein
MILARWAAAEHRCCPWAVYSVELSPFADGKGGEIQVRLRGTDEGKAFLTVAYQYLAALGGAAPPESIMDSKEKLTRDTFLHKLKAGCGC